MQIIIFKKKVSKGSRFNQIYIPKYLENEIQVGDEVEVKLVKKHIKLHYSKGLNRLSQFKEKLIQDIFSFLAGFSEIQNAFAVGSFLTEKIDYNDIDIVIISNKKIKNLDGFVYNKLINRFNLKFHILSIQKERFEYLLKACPLTRAMFSSYVSNKKVSLEKNKIIDRKHLKFLLMMPEDLLEISLSSRIFFDSLRRLVTIERFLGNKDLILGKINSELSDLISNKLYLKLKNNGEINEKIIEGLRKIIKIKLKKIKQAL